MSTGLPHESYSTSGTSDSSAGSAQNAVDFVTNRWQTIVGVVAVLALVIGGYFYYDSQQQELNVEGLTHLSRVRMTYDMGAYEQALTGKGIPPMGNEAVKGLVAISEEYDGTPAGQQAALMAGNAFVNLGKASEAEAQFSRAAGSSSQLIQVGAKQGLAAVREMQKNFSEAAALYEEAATLADKTGLEDRLTYNAAVCYEESKNTAKAQELYRLVVKKFEMSEVAASAKSGLARLGTAID
ncbi:MAG: tetratricopeptide repeat protein [Bacteroidota bacterium]|jgi:tetratricopeptide (TPR) repeat protein